jgi:hypothetical protein
MQDRSISELIEALRHVRIRETEIIEQLEEAVREAARREQDDEDIANVDVDENRILPAVIANGLRIRIGDRVRIRNKIRKPATAGPSWSEARERFATVTKVTTEQVHVVTDNGTKTWRAPNNLQLIRDSSQVE